jgi:hypothetical protein
MCCPVDLNERRIGQMSQESLIILLIAMPKLVVICLCAVLCLIGARAVLGVIPRPGGEQLSLRDAIPWILLGLILIGPGIFGILSQGASLSKLLMPTEMPARPPVEITGTLPAWRPEMPPAEITGTLPAWRPEMPPVEITGMPPVRKPETPLPR